MHAVYHALHLDGFGAGDAIALTGVLVAAPALPVLAIVISRREWAPAARPEHSRRLEQPTFIATAILSAE